MMRAIWLTLEKEMILLWRDRIGLFMLLVAPIAVITAAGFSLAKIYGGESGSKAEYPVAIVDQDHGEVAHAVTDSLARVPVVSVLTAGNRDEAIAMVRESKRAVVAIVIPAGTSDAIRDGRNAELVLYADPVRYLQTVKVELKLAELCRGISAEASARARAALAQRGDSLQAELESDSAAARDLKTQFEKAAVQAAHERDQAISKIEDQIRTSIATAQAQVIKQLNDVLADVEREATQRSEEQSQTVAEARDYLARLQRTQSQFEDWFAKLKQLAGKRAANIPDPPAFPTTPADLETRLNSSSGAIDVDGLRRKFEQAIALPQVSIQLPPIPPMPKLPSLADLAIKRIDLNGAVPGALGYVEQDGAGVQRRPGGFNVFDLMVPGFAVTFLMIGMLMGVSMALIDEHEWGTLARLRSAAAPLAATLAGKVLARFVVGFAQMAILLAAGYAIFGLSLGRAPLALLLPAAAIAFAGAGLGLLVAGVSNTRDAVLPVGAIVIMTMAAVGGCWWPIDFEPGLMQTIALGLPTTWAMRAFNDLMIRNLAPSASLLPSFINLWFGAVYVAAGTLLVRWRFV